MRIAYVGPSHPRIVQSSRFFTDFLKRRASEIAWFTDDRLLGGAALDVEQVLTVDPEMIVVWRVAEIAHALAERADAPRLVFAPTPDDAEIRGDAFWRPFLDRKRCRVLSFGDALHAQLTRRGVWSARLRYFPNPDAYRPAAFSDGLHGFFWQRSTRPSRRTIRTLTRDTDFARLHILREFDRFRRTKAPPRAQNLPETPPVAITSPQDLGAFDAALRSANVFFPPRDQDGGGMATLEAMALGQCVVAPDHLTLSEHLTHGLSGLLYDPKRPQPLDFSSAAQIGKRARELVEIGRQEWVHDLETRLPAIVFDDALDLEDMSYQDGGWWAWRRRKHPAAALSSAAADNALAPAPVSGDGRARAPRKVDRSAGPLVTVAIVTFNAKNEFPATLDSIVGQTYPNIEIVVVDGGSRDGTVDLIHRREAEIDHWIQEPDHGPYDAMNKAARLGAGEYIIYINAGDAFYAPDSVALAIRRAAEHNALNADFLIGHHFYLSSDGAQATHKAADFEQTWSRMTTADYSTRWIDEVPGHQATFTRRQLLVDHGGYDLSYQIAADHAFMYHRRAEGARFHNLDIVLAVYAGGGASVRLQQHCANDWWRIARTFGDPDAVDAFFIEAHGPQSVMDPERYKAVRAKIQASGLFFEEWYRQRYMQKVPPVADPISHYVVIGAAKGFDPSPLFDTRFYAGRQGEGGLDEDNPLLHYIDHGKAAGRPTRDWSDDADPMAALHAFISPDAAPTPLSDPDRPRMTAHSLAELLGRRI